MTNSITVTAPATGAVGQGLAITGTISPAADVASLQLSQQAVTLPTGVWTPATTVTGTFNGVVVPPAAGTWYVWAYDQLTGVSAVSAAVNVPNNALPIVNAAPLSAEQAQSLLAPDAALAAESEARVAGDAAAATALATEAGTRATADTGLQANITAEANARVAGDNTNATAISNEATTRATAVTALQAAITAAAGTANAAIPQALMGARLGVGTLDNTGHQPLAQVNAALLGAGRFWTVWNAATNTPTIASGIAPAQPNPIGLYVKVSVPGTTLVDGCADWNTNDINIWDGTVWNKIDGPAEAVTAVNGQVGPVAVQPQIPAAPAALQTGPTTLGGNPGTIPPGTAGRMLLDSSTAWTPVSMSGDATLSATGALVVTKTNGVALTPVATSTFGAAGGPPQLDPNVNLSGQTIAQNLSAFPTLAGLISYVPPVPQVFANKQVFNLTNIAADGDQGGGVFIGKTNLNGLGTPIATIPDQYINICPAYYLGLASTAAQLFTTTGSATITGTLPNFPLVPSNPNCPTPLTITCNGIVATDQGDGTLTGTGIGAATINYLTGAFSITYATAPTSGLAGTNNAYSYATNSFRIKRQYYGNKVFAEWFGYLPNGTDIGPLFKLVPQFSELHFKSAKYTISTPPSAAAISTLLIRGSSTLFLGLGLPTNAVLFDWSWPTGSSALFSGVDNNGNTYSDTARGTLSPIEGITLVGPSATTGTSIGIRIGNTTPSYFIKLGPFAVQGFATGLMITGSNSFLITGEKLTVKGNGTDLAVSYAGASNSGENLRFRHCYFGNAYTAGVNINQSVVNFDGCSFDYNYVHGIFLNSTIRIIGGSHIEGTTVVGGSNPPTPVTNTYAGAWFSCVNTGIEITGSEWADTTPSSGGPITYPYILLDATSHLLADIAWPLGTTFATHDVPLCNNAGATIQGRVRNALNVVTPYNGPGYAPMLSESQNFGAGTLMPITCELPFQTTTSWIRVTSPLYGACQNTLRAPNSGGASCLLNATFPCKPGSIFNLGFYDEIDTGPITSQSLSVAYYSNSGVFISQSYPLTLPTAVTTWTWRYLATVAPAGAFQVKVQWQPNTTTKSGYSGGNYDVTNLQMYES